MSTRSTLNYRCDLTSQVEDIKRNVTGKRLWKCTTEESLVIWTGSTNTQEKRVEQLLQAVNDDEELYWKFSAGITCLSPLFSRAHYIQTILFGRTHSINAIAQLKDRMTCRSATPTDSIRPI
ncbi:hypothetical protein ON010_g1201 [Phytophthora cinnamomi]|nr:hypothetical protein ON010_g1201 [Phytophthora cinnamomi]